VWPAWCVAPFQCAPEPAHVPGRQDSTVSAPGTRRAACCELPPELLPLVFNFLDPHHLTRAAAVCRQWSAVLAANDGPWAAALCRMFGPTFDAATLGRRSAAFAARQPALDALRVLRAATLDLRKVSAKNHCARFSWCPSCAAASVGDDRNEALRTPRELRRARCHRVGRAVAACPPVRPGPAQRLHPK